MPRNIVGVYSLPAGNPVVTNTLIQALWANTTMSDIADALTSSLDRNGQGSMLAAFKSVDGIVGQPGISWGNEPSMGIARLSPGEMSHIVGAVTRFKVTATGVEVVGVPFTFAAGTALLPSITFSGDLNTGLWWPGADTVALSTAGLERLRVDSAGNLGIGGTPGMLLDVVTATNGDRFRVRNTVTTFEAKLGLGVDSAYLDAANTDLVLRRGGTEWLRINNTGNIGLGVAPTSKLDIEGGAAGPQIRIRATGATTNQMRLGLDTVNGQAYIESLQTYPIAFYVNGSERARITSAGELLLGTNIVQAGYLFVNAGNIVVRRGAAANAILSLAGNNTLPGVTSFDLQMDNASNVDIVQRANSRMSFYTNAIERARFDSTGEFRPAADFTYSLGLAASRFNTVFASSFANGATGTNMLLDTSGATARFATGSSWTTLNLFTGGAVRIIVDSGGNCYPAVNNTQGSGIAANRWSNVYSVLGNFSGLVTASLGANFGNTAVASATTLDWYEEGTFTPTILFGGASVGLTYAQQTGRYTRVGELVFYTITLVLSAKGSSTGNVNIGGFPFTSAAIHTHRTSVTDYGSLSGIGGAITATISVATAFATLGYITALATGGQTIMNDTNFTNASYLNITGYYRA